MDDSRKDRRPALCPIGSKRTCLVLAAIVLASLLPVTQQEFPFVPSVTVSLPCPPTSYGRVTHPRGFRQQVWERSKSQDGNVYDPMGRILKYDEPWELGHRPGHKFSEAEARAMRERWDRETWIRYQNDPDIYRPELPSSNAGHRWE